MLTQIPQSAIDSVLLSKLSYWLLGFAAGLALFVEEKKRRAELAMYVLPKGLESLWIMLRGHGYVFKTGKWGETVVSFCFVFIFVNALRLMDSLCVQLTGIGMALVMVSENDFRSKSLRTDVEMVAFCFDVTFVDGVIQTTYQNDPQHLSGLVRRMLYQFIGPN